ncbi:MAG TPA: hypothetical protein VMV51_07215 [Gemmatimonadaceae bacterium]|nr:hypothetical protein [Gemmatimonadaceae bacterium]
MSRTRKATVAVLFGYAQFALSVGTGIFLFPFILRRVGMDAYGLWMAFGELLAYSAMLDLGMLSVLPWLIAEDDGRGDRPAMRATISAGLLVALIAAVASSVLAMVLLGFSPRVAHITEAQRALVLGPFIVMVVGGAVAYPLRVYYALLIGLQDSFFVGLVTALDLLLGIVITVAMLLHGDGLYALAYALVVPQALAYGACLIRAWYLVPDLVSHWVRPSRAQVRRLTTQGAGAWASGLGWRMVAATNSIVILRVAGPAMVAVYVVTSKLSDVFMQLSWQLPDAGLVGLAQLWGEGKPERVREIVIAMLRLMLLGAGGVACAFVAFNSAFVGAWVGPDKFAGMRVTVVIAASVLALSFGHSVISVVATLGKRVESGYATLAQGAVHLVMALALGKVFGLAGIAAAGVAGVLIVVYPFSMRALQQVTGLTQRAIWSDTLVPWLKRGVPLLVIGTIVGKLFPELNLTLVVLGPLLGVLYVVLMRGLLIGIPVPARARGFLTRVRLLAADPGAP